MLALWLTYAGAAALAVWLARRFAGAVSLRAGLLLALLPLLFTGKAMLLGWVYGPADLYFGHDPWKRVAVEHGVAGIANPILSDLAFANLPWRAAVREALVNGRLPFWNRFVLAGNPLLAAAQAGIFHPSTWVGVCLPLPLSWTFSCTFTIFLALLCAFLFFRDFRLSPLAASLGAIGWGFSTYVIFWNGWSVGLSTASFPLLLLGLRRMAADAWHGVGLTVAALLLAFTGGHPESFFHAAAAGGVYFLWELSGRSGREAMRAFGPALLAGGLTLLFSGPQLFPLLGAIRHSAEYRARRAAFGSPRATQSVSLAESGRRLLPAVLPFSHGIYGKSPVQSERGDGSGMPLAYTGAMLFPLAAVSLVSRRQRERGRSLFLGFFVVGLSFGASAPGLLDLVTRLPGFDLALNYRLVFLAALGLSGLAAFGAEGVLREGTSGRLAATSAASVLLLGIAFASSRGVFRERDLLSPFVLASFALETAPLLLLVAGAILLRKNGVAVVATGLALLVAQRGLEMSRTYPTWPARAAAPRLPTLEKLPPDGPYRIAAAGDVLRPNGAALYGLEDVRGYESLILDRFADTFPLWSTPQPASFNRIEDLSRPFLSFLNVRFAIAPPDAPVPHGWREYLRGDEMAIFENPRALARAFAPRRVRYEPDAGKTLAQMARASDFSDTAWLARPEAGGEENNAAQLSVRAVGPDLLISTDAPSRLFVATSLPDWPGWEARSGSEKIPIVTTNYAFVGFWLPAGRRTARLSYRPPSFFSGVAAFALAVAVGFGAARLSRG